MYPAIVVVIVFVVAAASVPVVVSGGVGSGGVVTLTRSLARPEPKRANLVFGACLPVYVCLCVCALSCTRSHRRHSLFLISLSFFYPNYQRRLAFTCLYFGITFIPPSSFPNSNACQKMAPHFYLPAELMEKS